ncbi:PQQ-like beta-propeller repeat protein [Rhodopirellula sp. JC740]|uniref:PQQ-like beta-propeller repeat protein n=1 Tax=Rhodopirellula halodulae TaxID=2894198 RepID=A0ABS8NCC3_9BACT|nr:PQQ-binding-like beta-propeller repeat protein [Rhodopirellula sp. JC740]MCC9641206.1 PQQ-like beta-propeller repeat protein [Rhodopirellula sp. JC740]
MNQPHTRPTTPTGVNFANSFFKKVAGLAAVILISGSPVFADQASPASSPQNDGHKVLLHGKTGLVVVQQDGSISWQMDWGGIHDLHLLPNGNILTRKGRTAVVEIDPNTKQVVWSYNSAKQGGNTGKRVEIHAFDLLPNGNVMIAESGAGRIIEVDRSGTIQHEIQLRIDHPDPHSDTRLVRRLESGNYLVAHERDGKAREYDRSGKVVWEYTVPMFGKEAAGGHGPEAFGNRLFAAIRLKNGNTLIASGNGHSVLEVTAEKQIVWQIHQHDLPGIQLAWVTTLQVLGNGNYVIGNCHAGPGQPILIEIEPASKKVVWQLDRFDDFGNNVSNSLVIDEAKFDWLQ